MLLILFFFFKQKTAYEMRISDWSSDVCSSDLPRTIRANSPKPHPLGRQCHRVHAPHGITEADERTVATLECATQKVTEAGGPKPATIGVEGDRKSVV